MNIAYIDTENDLNLFGHDFKKISEQNTDYKISNWLSKHFSGKDYNRILIPCRIGNYDVNNTGLIIAAHIRLHKGIGQNRNAQIVILTDDKIKSLQNFGSLINQYNNTHKYGLLPLTDGIELIHFYDIHNLDSLALTTTTEEKFINQSSVLGIFQDISDNNHNVSNIWGAYIFNQILNLNVLDAKEFLISDSLYFKFITQKNNLLHDKIDFLNLNSTDSLKTSNLLLIDDNADKYWKSILKEFTNNCSGKFKSVPNISDWEKFYARIKTELKKEDNGVPLYDIVLLDLRLRKKEENSNISIEELSGYKILKEIKSLNQGIQVIIFTASNKALNMKSLLEAGADAYYIKESPVLFDLKNAKNQILNFYESIVNLAKKSPLKSIFIKLSNIKILIELNNIISEDLEFELISYLDIATILLKDFNSDQEKHQSRFIYLQLFTLIEKCARHDDFIYGKDNVFVKGNHFELPDICIAKKMSGKKNNYKSVITMSSGNYKLRSSICKINLDTNFRISAILLILFGHKTSGEKNWTRVYSERNDCAHKSHHPSLEKIELLIDFLNYFFNAKNYTENNIDKGLPPPSKEEIGRNIKDIFENR